MSSEVPILDVRSLRKVFTPSSGRATRQELVAVADVSFDVERGAALAIVGESGSGKTTIARMIIGLERATAGHITVCGEDRSTPAGRARDRRRRARQAQMVFQDPYSSLDRSQSVSGCLDEVLRVHFARPRDERAQRVRELLEQVGLSERHCDALPKDLSGGQRQRVAIARALAAEPKILVLDEAVAALDVSIQAQILNLLADLRDEASLTYVVITHDLAVARQLTNETVVMQRGRVVERGATAAILDSPHESYTRMLRDSVPGPGWVPSRRLRSHSPVQAER